VFHASVRGIFTVLRSEKRRQLNEKYNYI